MLRALCVARRANAAGPTGRQAEEPGAWQRRRAGLNMRTWLQPTTKGYLGRVPKALILDAVQFGAGASAAHADLVA